MVNLLKVFSRDRWSFSNCVDPMSSDRRSFCNFGRSLLIIS